MKRFLLSLFFLLTSLSFIVAQQKDVATVSFKVNGNCSMCKKRIEDAAYIKGVKLAEWNETTKTLTVTYRPSKTSVEAVQQHVAQAGHDTEQIPAPETAYRQLPDCCAYKTASCNHK